MEFQWRARSIGKCLFDKSAQCAWPRRSWHHWQWCSGIYFLHIFSTNWLKTLTDHFYSFNKQSNDNIFFYFLETSPYRRTKNQKSSLRFATTSTRWNQPSCHLWPINCLCSPQMHRSLWFRFMDSIGISRNTFTNRPIWTAMWQITIVSVCKCT